MHVNTVRRGLAVVALCATAALGLTACQNNDGKPAANASSDGAGRTTAPGASPSAPPATQPTPPTLARLSAKEIVRKATGTMTSVHSLTADMKARSDGKAIALHVTLDTTGECTGRITQGSAHAKIIATRTHLYLQADDAFLRQMGGTGALELLRGKWMKTSRTSADAKDLSGFCDLKDVLSGFQEKPYKPAKGALTALDGTRVVPVSDKDPKDGSRTTAYVAADGSPYVLEVVTVGGSDPGTLRLSHFDEPVHVGAPPADQIVDMDKLGS